MNTSTLKELVNTPDDKRDDQWEDQFFHALTSGQVAVVSDQPIQGPDGWPYLWVKAGEDTGATEPISKVLEWLAKNGAGLVVNAHKEYPDYVFTHGMIWSFCETGWFFQRTPDESSSETEVEFAEGQKILAGSPSEEYWPSYARAVVREFLRQQGVTEPKVLVLSRDGNEYDLAFSLESLGNPPSHEHEGILEAISWFMPPHYSLMLISEEGLPEFELV